MPGRVRLDVEVERWPLAAPFTIARGSKSEAVVVVVTLEDDDGVRGRGEAVPYPRYGETPDGVRDAIRGLADAVHDGLDRRTLTDWLPAGAARNALDLALLDLEAKRTGRPAWRLAGLETPTPLTSAYTLPIRDPETSRAVAARERHRPLLKLKVEASGTLERVRAVREAAPDSRLIVDANEGWDLAALRRAAPQLARLGVELIEQPLPAGDDASLAGWESPVPICADESFRGEPALLDGLAARYDAVNVKLDKQGGLTTAREAVTRARALGLDVMVGTMVATSLAVAPAVLLAGEARWADLDGALFLARDRTPGLRFDGAVVHPPTAALWG
ncbi:MAG TPA: N-acetyl-D-Glu racemase DgcA [Sandaracinaceae bacterium LLY-WYZ-13_1]|nr:N-acetyl-D-Glu racemase DgcA [Sandaracinaceae bacterium LLY-WYZ-13_1]